jgi:hypothetical protein
MTRLVPLVALLVAAPPLAAQSLPPVRPIGQTVARSTEVLGSVSTVVGLPGGRLLVNDILKRRVLLFDSTLTEVRVIADSTSSTANAYGRGAGGLLAYRGDSALFVDPPSMSMLVIAPNGEITRVMSAPRPEDVSALIGGPNGVPGFDASGHLVYRQPVRPRFSTTSSGRPVPEFPDSVPVVRFNLAARSLDTAAFFNVQKPDIRFSETATGAMTISSSTNPLPTVDDWALLSDGTVAIVRGKDYSVEFVAADGSRTSSGKIPYEWQRLDDDGKAALLDSVRAEMEKARQRAMEQMAAGGGPVFVTGAAPAGAGDMVIIRGGAAGGAPPARGGGAAGRGEAGRGANIQMPPINLVNADELPDYRPPFTAGSARGDLEGNLWVRTTSPVGNEGPIYFVINRQGQVIDRVQLPAGRLVVGFGAGGDVYLALRDADENARVERARIR